MKTIAIIQARMSSSRLPGKILKNFSNNLNMLEMQLQTLQKILNPKHIYIATTTNRGDDMIQTKYQDTYNVYRGEEDDVLSRFLDIIQESKADTIIRIASDNPFIFYEGISYLLDRHKKNAADYTTFSIEEIPSMLVPCGLYVEVVSSKALLDVEKKADKTEKEHVTYALYTRLKENHKVQLLAIQRYHKELNNKNLRYTVDTAEDFLFIDQTIQELNINKAIDVKTIQKIIKYSNKNHHIEKMQKESKKEKNSKKYN